MGAFSCSCVSLSQLSAGLDFEHTLLGPLANDYPWTTRVATATQKRADMTSQLLLPLCETMDPCLVADIRGRMEVGPSSGWGNGSMRLLVCQSAG